MAETFKEICKVLSKHIEHSRYGTASPDYTPKELLYLALWNKLGKLVKSNANNEKQELNSKTVKDDTCIDNRSYLKSALDGLGLKGQPDKPKCGMPGLASKPKLDYHTPHLFDGCFEIHGRKANVRTHESELAISIIDSKYRYCSVKPSTTINIHLEKLRGFGRIGKMNAGITSGEDLSERCPSIVFRRNLDIVAWVALYPLDTSYTLVSLHLLNVTLTAFVKCKIDAFLRGDVGSAVLLADLVYIYRSNGRVDVDFSLLICRLEDMMSMCSCDEFCYELYCYIGLLIKAKQIALASNENTCNSCDRSLHKEPRSSIFDPCFNCPIAKDDRVPTFLFTRLASKILAFISVAKNDKGFTAKAYQKFKFYMSIGIVLNKIFVHKLYALYSGTQSLADRIFEMSLLETGTEDAWKKIWVLFGRDLNDSIKAKGDVGSLYKLLFANFRTLGRGTHFVAPLFEEICKVHARRIKKSRDVEELKALHTSMIICEKSLGKRSEKVERMLKAKVADLLKK